MPRKLGIPLISVKNVKHGKDNSTTKTKMRRMVKNGAIGPRQAYLNKRKYNPNLYKQEKDRISREIEFVMTSLCCRRCCEIIQWKVDYGKYVPQELARRCNLCREKKVSLSYHRICQECAEEAAVCAKCQKSPLSEKQPAPVDDTEDNFDEEGEEVGNQSKYDFVDRPIENEELQYLRGLNVRVLQERLRRKKQEKDREDLSTMRERERRTVLRKAVVEVETSDGDESL